MRIGILSDTHGLLRPEVLDALQGCAAILHGGDINRQGIIDTLEEIAPVFVVRGNNDKEWAENVPMFLDFTLFGLRIYMTHKKKDLPADLSGYDLVIFGHSHRYEERTEGRTLLLNPGSCGPRRFNQDITLAIAEIEEEAGKRGGDSGADPQGAPCLGDENLRISLNIRRIDIPHAGKAPANLKTVRKDDIEKAIRAVKKGKTVAEISAGLGMEPELAEQICRMYLTHPGVDAEGVMRRIEIHGM